MNPAHRALRDRTAEAHERLDALFGGFDLADRASYARFLAAHAEAIIPLEAALDRAGAARVLADWPGRRRGDALRADLADLAAAPLAPAPPVLLASGDPQLLGALYVLEGSRLGGRFLARQVPAKFPRRYLDAEQPRGNWTFLLAQLDALLYDRSSLDMAVAAALDAFARFETSGRAWLVKG